MNVVRDLRLTGIKKYERHVSQIKKKVNWLYKNQIPALAMFVKYFQRMHNNEKMIENMKIALNVDFK